MPAYSAHIAQQRAIDSQQVSRGADLTWLSIFANVSSASFIVPRMEEMGNDHHLPKVSEFSSAYEIRRLLVCSLHHTCHGVMKF